jgi:DNA-binding protein
MDDQELEMLRQKRMAEIQQQQGGQQQAQAEQARQFEAQKQAMLRQILTPEARDRLANVKLASPELANTVEMQLIQLAQSGRLKGMVNDDMLRNILRQIAPQRREISIERR